MTPLTFITGVLLGTSASIAFGLLIVMLLFLLLGTNEPQIAPEWSRLSVTVLIFLLMTMICAISFIGLLRNKPWRWLAQGVLWAGVIATVSYYVA